MCGFVGSRLAIQEGLEQDIFFDFYGVQLFRGLIFKECSVWGLRQCKFVFERCFGAIFLVVQMFNFEKG